MPPDPARPTVAMRAELAVPGTASVAALRQAGYHGKRTGRACRFGANGPYMAASLTIPEL